MTNLLTNARNRNKIKHDILFLSPDWAAEVSKVSQQNITTEIQSKSWGKSCLRSPKSSICGKELLWMPMFQMCFWMGCPMVKEEDIEEVQREEREVETNCANNLESLVETQEMDWPSWLCRMGENREDVNEEDTDWPVAMIYSCRALQKNRILQNIKKAFTLFAKLETHQCSALLM